MDDRAGTSADRLPTGTSGLTPGEGKEANQGDIHMTTAALTGADVRLRDSVIRELDWDPEVDDSAIGVTAQDGVVTLTGFIDTYAGKLAAERVVKRLVAI